MRLCRCGRIVDKKCDHCDRESKAKHAKFYASWKWRTLSEKKRNADPLCECCLIRGEVRAAKDVHHVVSVDESVSLRFVWSNLMSVCKACHKELDAKRRGGDGKVSG